MAIYQGDTKISGNAKVSSLPLFTTQWQDHITNDASWVRSETFSWQSGAVYVSAYNHLAADVSGVTSETETVAGTTITFKRATDGHKIVDDTQVSNVEAIYNATGVAWYYVLDTTNTRFKLPRSKYNFVGLRDNVGNYVAESLPNINAEFGGVSIGTNSGAVTSSQLGSFSGASSGGGPAQKTFDASLSSSVYQNDAPVQQRATQMYLYFYVGNTVQDQTAIDVGEITEELNDKADIDLANITSDGKQEIVTNAMPDYANGITVSGVTAGTWTQVAKDSFVIVRANDPFMADVYLYVSPDNGTTKYTVGWWYNDINSNTKGSSWSFFVPKGWYFTSEVENPYTAYIYPLKGAQ